jgi:hypothetical protein
VQVIQDESLNGGEGYRRYINKEITITGSAGIKKEALPKVGFLDSIILDSKVELTPSAHVLDAIKIIQDEADFPLSSNWGLEQAKNTYLLGGSSATFDSNICYCDLIRPINAQEAKTLDFEFKVTTLTSNQILGMILEFVHLIKNR